MRASTLCFMILAVSVPFAKNSPLRAVRVPEPRGGGDDGAGMGGDAGFTPIHVNETTNPDGAEDNLEEGTRARGKSKRSSPPPMFARTESGSAGNLCGTRETKERGKNCKAFKLKRDYNAARKREEDEAKYTPKSKEDGEKQVERLDGQLTTLLRAAEEKQCDYAVEIQIFDFVLWENLFCSTLDSLVTIVEPEGEEKSAFKSKLMLGAIEIATSEDNMWEVDEATYRDKLVFTRAVITGERVEEDDNKSGNKGLTAYLEKAEKGVAATASKFSAAIQTALEKAEEEANKRANDDEEQKKKVKGLIEKMDRLPESIEAGIEKDYQDTMTAAGDKGNGTTNDATAAHDTDDKDTDSGEGENDKSPSGDHDEKE